MSGPKTSRIGSRFSTNSYPELVLLRRLVGLLRMLVISEILRRGWVTTFSVWTRWAWNTTGRRRKVHRTVGVRSISSRSRQPSTGLLPDGGLLVHCREAVHCTQC